MNVYRRRVPYIADPSLYKDYYRGAGLPAFRGTTVDGSGLLGNFLRSALPIIKPFAISAGKNLLRSGAAALSDVVSGEKDVKTDLKQRSLEGLKHVGKDISSRLLRTFKSKKEDFESPPRPESAFEKKISLMKSRRIRYIGNEGNRSVNSTKSSK